MDNTGSCYTIIFKTTVDAAVPYVIPSTSQKWHSFPLISALPTYTAIRQAKLSNAAKSTRKRHSRAHTTMVPTTQHTHDDITSAACLHCSAWRINDNILRSLQLNTQFELIYQKLPIRRKTQGNKKAQQRGSTCLPLTFLSGETLWKTILVHRSRGG